jgi:tetratricopeptide (TPR) repeat protein
MDLFKAGSQMTRGNTITALAAIIVLLAAWAGSALLQTRIDREKAGTPETPESLWVASPRAVKAMSLGHEGLLGNIYWTRVVQYYGRRHGRDSDFRLLHPLLDIATTLDPHLLIAYYFGAFFLSQPPPGGAGDPHKAIELLYKGVRANPDNWRFYHFIGFTYYWDLQDYDKAAAAYQEGARNPKAAGWMRVMAAQITERGGSRETSYFLWSQIFTSTADPAIRQNALGHMQSLQAQEDLEDIQMLAERFRAQTGRWPSAFSEMISAGLLRTTPVDPAGFAYQLGSEGVASLHPETTIKLEAGSAPKPPAAPPIG